LLYVELALANVGNKFPTWEEILAIVALDVLLIVGAFFLIRRSIRKSRQVSRSAAAEEPSQRHPGRFGVTARERDDAENGD
jgi:hypothetical protein